MNAVMEWLTEAVREGARNALVNRVTQEAMDLRSEQGENPEYDRALVELTMRILDYHPDDREAVEAALGIVKPKHVGTPHYGATTTTITCSCGWQSSADNERRVDSAMEFNQHFSDSLPDGVA